MRAIKHSASVLFPQTTNMAFDLDSRDRRESFASFAGPKLDSGLTPSNKPNVHRTSSLSMPMSNAFQEFGPITQDPNTGGNLPTIFDKGESENSNPETNQYADSVLSHKNFAGI